MNMAFNRLGRKLGDKRKAAVRRPLSLFADEIIIGVKFIQSSTNKASHIYGIGGGLTFTFEGKCVCFRPKADAHTEFAAKLSALHGILQFSFFDEVLPVKIKG